MKRRCDDLNSRLIRLEKYSSFWNTMLRIAIGVIIGIPISVIVIMWIFG